MIVEALINRPPKNALRLELKGSTNVDLSQMYRHCKAAMASGFPILQDRGRITQQPIVIVGDSPDLPEHLKAIIDLKAAGAKIMAVKRTHDWLLARGITPDYAICANINPDTVDIFKYKTHGVTYLVASISHPDMWEYLRGYAVIIWHPKADKYQKVAPEWEGVKKVYGGCTTGLRAISLSWILGHREVVLVGFQSCVANNGVMRATGGKTFANDEAFPVAYAGKWFWTTANLAQQVQDFMPTLQMCPGIKITAIGDGALPHVLKTGKAAGWPV